MDGLAFFWASPYSQQQTSCLDSFSSNPSFSLPSRFSGREFRDVMASGVNIHHMKHWWSLLFEPWSHPQLMTNIPLWIFSLCWGPVWSTSLSSWPLWTSSHPPNSSLRLSLVLSELSFSAASTALGKKFSHQHQRNNLQPNTVDLEAQTSHQLVVLSIPHSLSTESQHPKNGIPLNGVNRKLLCIGGKMSWDWWHLNSCRCHCSIWRHIIVPFISLFKLDSAQ